MKHYAFSKQRTGPWLALVRITWCIVACITIGLIVTTIVNAMAAPPGPSLHVTPICATCGHVPLKGLQKSALYGSGLYGYILYLSILCSIFSLCHFIVAGVLVWRKSDDWLALFAAFTLTLLAVAYCGELPSVPSSIWHTLDTHTMYLGVTLLFLFFCLFPLGHLTPWWSYCLVAATIWYGATSIVFTKATSNTLNQIVVYGLLAGLALLQIYRYRRVSDPALRRQTKWVVFGICGAVLIYLAQQLYNGLWTPPHGSLNLLNAGVSETLFFFALLLIPLSIGIAILRSHLWNIDLIIHRTLVYGALSACVVGLYVLVVGGLGTLLQGQGNVLISLLATGLIAALFQPLRERLQRAVSYLVYGERSDPYQVLSRLNRRLETTLIPGEILSTIVETVALTFRLSYAAIILKQGEREELSAVYGQAGPEEKLLPLALTYQGEMLGELVVSDDPSGEAFSARNQRLLEDLARHAGTAVYAARLHAALQHSREQLVTAREEERRRLRRDLHDGLGPQLASLMLVLTTVRKTLRSNPAGAEYTLTEAMTHLQEAISDIRRLVYGLRPPALDDLGLLAALQEDLRSYQASGIVCELVAPACLPALPAAVEVACYRIVREALTNVLKHAQASRCVVRLSVGETLDLEVVDDGKGLPPGWKSGVGLTSLRERAQELGGTCSIKALPTGGTCVSAHLPWKPAERVASQQGKDLQHGAYSFSHR